LAYILLIAAFTGTAAAIDSAGIGRKRSSLPYKSNYDQRQMQNQEDDPFLGMLEDMLVEKSMSLSMPMETATPDMYAYLTYYSDFISCSDLVVTMPIISDVEFTLPALMDLTGSCHDLAVCIIDQESEGCKAVGGADAERTSARVIVGNDGVYECDDSTEAAGLNNEQVCNLISPNACLESSVLPGCFYRYITGSKLSSDMNSNCDEEVEAEDEDVDQYAYLTFNSDDKCTELAVAKPIKSDNEFTVPLLMDLTGTCDALAACVIDQNSPQCEAVGGADAELAANKVTVRSDGVYECDESNEAHNEETCNMISSTDCLESSVLPGCYFKYVTNAKLSDDMSSNCDEESGGPPVSPSSPSTTTPSPPSTGNTVVVAISWFAIGLTAFLL